VKERKVTNLGPPRVWSLWLGLGCCQCVAEQKHLICIQKLLSCLDVMRKLALSDAAGLTRVLLSLRRFLRSQVQTGSLGFLELLFGR